jgi:hypothetical protein
MIFPFTSPSVSDCASECDDTPLGAWVLSRGLKHLEASSLGAALPSPTVSYTCMFSGEHPCSCSSSEFTQALYLTRVVHHTCYPHAYVRIRSHTCSSVAALLQLCCSSGGGASYGVRIRAHTLLPVAALLQLGCSSVACAYVRLRAQTLISYYVNCIRTDPCNRTHTVKKKNYSTGTITYTVGKLASAVPPEKKKPSFSLFRRDIDLFHLVLRKRDAEILVPKIRYFSTSKCCVTLSFLLPAWRTLISRRVCKYICVCMYAYVCIHPHGRPSSVGAYVCIYAYACMRMYVSTRMEDPHQ